MSVLFSSVRVPSRVSRKMKVSASTRYSPFSSARKESKMESLPGWVLGVSREFRREAQGVGQFMDRRADEVDLAFANRRVGIELEARAEVDVHFAVRLLAVEIAGLLR